MSTNLELDPSIKPYIAKKNIIDCKITIPQSLSMNILNSESQKDQMRKRAQ